MPPATPKTRPLMIYRRYMDVTGDSSEWSKSSGGAIYVPWKTDPVDPDEPAFSFVAACIEKAIQLLHTSKAHALLYQIAIMVKERYSDLKLPFTDNHRAHLWIDNNFLPNIRDQFPVVIIDDQTKRNVKAFVQRGGWKEEYWGNGIYVSLSGNDIKRLKEHAATTNKNDVPKYNRYKDYMAAIIVTLLHEIGGHYLVTHCTGGQKFAGTPIELKDHRTDYKALGIAERHVARGESGYWFVNQLLDIGWESHGFDSEYVQLLRKEIPEKGKRGQAFKVPSDTIEAILNGHESAFLGKTGDVLYSDPPPTDSDVVESKSKELESERHKHDDRYRKDKAKPRKVIIENNASIHKVPFDPNKRVEVTGVEDKRKHESSSESEGGLRGGPAAGKSKAPKPKKTR